MFLTIDIGGTNMRARVWTKSSEGEREKCILRKKFSSSPHAHSEIQAFISEHKDKIRSGCIAVAGPVRNGRVQLTNVDISLDEREFDIPIRIINDMEAAGYGISELVDEQIHQVHSGICEENGIATVIGLGTGVGQTIVVPSLALPKVIPSEGGHIEYAPRNQEEQDFCTFLNIERNIERVRVEDILSGTGITHMWDFFEHLKYEQKLSVEGHVGGYIASNPNSEISKDVMNLYSGILGSYLGNLALQTLPTGGLWICGGVAQKMYRYWNVDTLRRQFSTKLPMESILKEFSIHVVLDDDVGVLGALRVAKKNLQH
jgi:glucokinase